MRKYGKRVAALALSLVVALGSVCYNPPKAEAVVVESAAAMAGAFTYLSATGFEFAGDGTAYGAMADAFQMMFADLTEEYDAYVNEVSGYPEVVAPTLQETILGGMTLLENGYVEFSAAAANALGRFEDWLIDKLGLIGEDGMSVTDAVTVVPGNSGGLSIAGFALPDFADLWIDRDTYPYVYVYHNNGVFALNIGNKKVVMQSDGKLKVSGMSFTEYLLKNGTWEKSGSYVNRDLTVGPLERVIWTNYDICDTGGSVVQSGYNLADSYSPILSVSLSANYEAAPTVEEQYAMVVNPGLTFEDEQSYIDAVMNGVVAGTLAPAYTIEQATSGDVVVPGEEEQENTQTGILSWTKKIWESVQELPRTIADAVADVFVPSAEYMATVPVVITETFDNRTGFLTYPVSVLHDFAGRLSAGSQDFVLKWPTVYEPYTKGQLMAAGQFNISKYVRDNDFASDVYDIYQWVVKAYMTFLFLGLCRKKYNSVVGDRLGG